MCGIAGLFESEGIVEKKTILHMTESVRHRGPDGLGVQMFPNGGIGNRRLSIIDPETGGQPLCNGDGTIWITFNGEIYNFRELRTELKKAGHSFRTSSDTEVVVHAYEEWGYASLNRLRGMFAFGIVDTRKRKLILARDHFGIKPLYYLSIGNRFAFASELMQFNYIPDCKLTLDLQSIDQYLWLKYIPAPRSVFKNVYKLRPAHFLVVSFDGKLEQSQQYWNVDLSRKESKGELEWLEGLNTVLRQSVEAHLVSDVPVGAFLSGGLDSAIVVRYMSEFMKEPVKTFSIGFREEKFNELPFSSRVAERYHTDHHSEIVEPRALEALPDLVRHYGEPFGDSSCIPTYYLSKLARQFVKVALSGDGGDECLIGYNNYTAWLTSIKRNNRKRKLPIFLSKVNPFARSTARADYWLKRKLEVSRDWRAKIWKRDFSFAYKDDLKEFNRIFKDARHLSLANRMQYVDLKTYLPNDILVKVDIASMFHGLEVRTPFVDKEVWDFIATIPEEFNINDHQTPGQYQGKLLLKKLLAKDFEPSFIHRRKKGFSIPLDDWASDSGDWRGILMDRLLSIDSKVIDYFDRATVESLMRNNHWSIIWRLLFLEEWLRNFSSADSPSLAQ